MPGYTGSSTKVAEEKEGFLNYFASDVSTKLNIITILLLIVVAMMGYKCIMKK